MVVLGGNGGICLCLCWTIDCLDIKIPPYHHWPGGIEQTTNDLKVKMTTKVVLIIKIMDMELNEWLALIAALGGWEAMRWGITAWTNRKTNARKEDAAADSMENENERKQVAWLEERIAQRDAKIDGLYAEMRQEQKAHLETIHKFHESELRQKEAEVKRCDIRGCTKRQPPSDY